MNIIKSLPTPIAGLALGSVALGARMTKKFLLPFVRLSKCLSW